MDGTLLKNIKSHGLIVKDLVYYVLLGLFFVLFIIVGPKMQDEEKSLLMAKGAERR